MTKQCEFEYGSFMHTDPWNRSGWTYTGSHVNGIPHGVGSYEKDNYIYYGTLENNEWHGFIIYHNKSDGYQFQSEIRSNEWDGLDTTYSSS